MQAWVLKFNTLVEPELWEFFTQRNKNKLFKRYRYIRNNRHPVYSGDDSRMTRILFTRNQPIIRSSRKVLEWKLYVARQVRDLAPEVWFRRSPQTILRFGVVSSPLRVFSFQNMHSCEGYAVSHLFVVSWLLLSEIFPAGIKGRAVSIATILNWGTNLIVSLTFLDMLSKCPLKFVSLWLHKAC